MSNTPEPTDPIEPEDEDDGYQIEGSPLFLWLVVAGAGLFVAALLLLGGA